MGALVVYESMFGNTEAVAQAVAEGLGSTMPVEVVEVGDARALELIDTDLLVVGAPTHVFGLSRPQTRRDAVARGGAVISDARAMRDWLGSRSSLDLRVAAFDTHVKVPPVPGSAAQKAIKLLERRGCTAVDQPTSFYVHGYEGPLYPDELQRAKDWGTHLGTCVARLDAKTTPAT